MFFSKSKKVGGGEVYQEVLDYINKEIKKGISESLIRDVLLKAGHDPRVIERHFNHINNRKKSVDGEVYQEVLDYINKEIKKGISESLIRGVLLKAGHDPKIIDKHFSIITDKKFPGKDDHNDVSDFIRKEIKKGIKGSIITSVLLKAGHDPEIIKKCFNHVTNKKILIQSFIFALIVISAVAIWTNFIF